MPPSGWGPSGGTTPPQGSQRWCGWCDTRCGCCCPRSVVWAVVVSGVTAVAVSTGAALAGPLVWWRAHPPTYDRFAAPRVRSVWRRWTTYGGRHWVGVLGDCEL